FLSLDQRLAAGAGVRQQCHFTVLFDCLRDSALLLDGHTGYATCTNLAAVGDEFAYQSNIFVVDVVDLRCFERIRFWFRLTNFSLSHLGAPFYLNLEPANRRDG